MKQHENRNVEEYLDTHIGKKPHECEDCHEGFADEKFLKSHMESNCEKIKIQKIITQNSVEDHEGKKPHECEHCHEGFADEQFLKSHMESNCKTIKIQKIRTQNSVYKSRQEIIQKYGYTEYANWFQEESFFNYWQVHCNGRGVPLYEINLAKRQKLRGESKNQIPENDDQKSESDIQIPGTDYLKLQEHDSIRFQCPYCESKFSQNQNLKRHVETHKNKVDDNTDNENLLEHNEKEEAITNNNEIVDIPQVQIEVIEGIELKDIDWKNVEYIYVPEIVEKPTDTDPVQASCNQLDQAEAIEEPILEEIVDQNPEALDLSDVSIV